MQHKRKYIICDGETDNSFFQCKIYELNPQVSWGNFYRQQVGLKKVSGIKTVFYYF